MSQLLSFFWKNNIPRWSILIIDVIISAFSLTLAFFLRFNFAHIPEADLKTLPVAYSITLLVRFITFFISKTYKGVVRYTGSKDAMRILFVIIIGSSLLVLFDIITRITIGIFYIPLSVIIIDALVTMFIMICSRLAVKAIYFESRNPEKQKSTILIYGAGESGLITKRILDRDAAIKYKVVGFIDDDPKKKGRSLEGSFIYSPDKLESLISENDVESLIISILNISPSRKNEIIERCINQNIKVLTVPPVSKWINGELSFNQLKSVNIESLLERDPIKLNIDLIKNQLYNKRILVTGAAGSIGSELARQILPFQPKRLFLLDQAESPLHELELELTDKFSSNNFETVIADIRNKDRLENVFKSFIPELVFHAAAYKHVPMMENNPSESILTNILGTISLARLSVEFQVKKFVMVSTDKAVNPTNVMGASKRIAEIFVQSLNKKIKSETSTQFITTRFGNVLGSNGSVIQLFKKQLQNGGPLTITHPDVTRFFMTIPEACQLVLEAGMMGKGGEIFIFDMGKSVKIIDLAKNMIKLAGLELGKDINIATTGLRPGEKLYEELLNDSESTIPTHHEKIMIASVREYDFELVEKNITELITLFKTQQNDKIVGKMKELVPEYISNNSPFEKLDTK